MARLFVLLIRRWAILPWTRGENARLHYLESIDVCIVGLGQSRVMQWRASVSAALLLLLGASGGFCSHIVGGVAEHLGARAFSKSWREHLPGFLCARAIPFIVNEWTSRGGGGVRPHPSPTQALQRANLSYRTTGRHKAIRGGKNTV